MNTPDKQTTDRENDMDTDVSPEERQMLDESMNNSLTEDNINLRRSELDNTDEDGELLNEGSMADDISGADLDVPGAEADDDNESIGEEDEQNNQYSQADTE